MTLFTPSVNELGRVITNPRARAVIYLSYIILLVIVGAATVGFASLGLALPGWIIVANAVTSFLGFPVSGLALANIPPTNAVVPVVVPTTDTAALSAVNPANQQDEGVSA
jgi:hypothetical protein